MKPGTRRKTIPAVRGPLSRRAAPARLGLGAASVYTAPTVPHLDRSANAQVVPKPCKGKLPAWCRRDAPAP